MKLHLVILGAGKGSRMKSNLPKVLHTLANKPLLQHVVDTSTQLNPSETHVVIGHGAEQVKSQLDGQQLSWVLQEEQLGTGHAVAQAMPGIPDDAVVLILYGDVPLTEASSLQALLAKVDDSNMGLMTINLSDPTGYGRIVRNSEGAVQCIVEEKDADPVQKQINEVNTGIMAVQAKQLKSWLPALKANNAQGEYYLTDIIAMAMKEGVGIAVEQPSHSWEVEGVNTLVQLENLERIYQRAQAHKLLLAGVRIMDTTRFDLRGELVAGNGCEIDINCVLIGRVELGNNVKIGPNCVITDCRIGDNSEILPNCVIDESSIANGAIIGPFARLRPGTQLADNTKIGNFVETKKTQVGKGSKINHLSYVGDTTLGERVNIGAGTITCNYDGVNKYQTILEDDVFVGSNTSLVAPVKAGQNATIGAGSVITKDVEPNQLAVARGKQRNIDGWEKPKKD